MSQDATQPDSPALTPAPAPAPADVDHVPLFRRSPHPYLRHRDEILGQLSERTVDVASQAQLAHDAALDGDGRKRRKPASQSPSESGTEADDEGYSLVKALPAPPLRPHKGLRESRPLETGEWASPLLTPTQIDDEAKNFSGGFFDGTKKNQQKGSVYHVDDETRAARQKYMQRRRNELVRRTTETALLAGIGMLAVHGCDCWIQLLSWHRGQHCFDECLTTLTRVQ